MHLPPLDCHAHLSVDLTARQLEVLGSAIVFAMTRDMDEAFEASKRYDKNILWACGAHPSNIAKTTEFDVDRFARRARDFAIIGEVGLDRRSGNLEHQKSVFDSILASQAGQSVLLSIHSAGCSAEIVESIEHAFERPGLIMHWFTGSPDDAFRLVELGCYFSVNALVRPELLAAVPLDRLLPETDFPVARKRTGVRPGDTTSIERIVGELHGMDQEAIRVHFYRNLRRMVVSSGAIDRLPARLADLLLTAA